MSSMDFRKLPPLKSLKGFEATARLRSVRRAAEELNLTHPAITHQIQTLEESLGVKLFSREGRSLVLTAEGERYYPCVRGALEQLLQGADAIRPAEAPSALRVQTYISFAICWLAHRLAHFRARHPEIKLHLATSGADWDFDEANADIGVIYRSAPLPSHLHWVKLFDSRYFPVCSPKLLDNRSTELRPQDLMQYPLITVNSEDQFWNWHQWFESTGLKIEKPPETLVVDTLVVALEMAVDGEGIALVNGPLADSGLRSGRLVMPVEHYADGQGQWGIVCRKDLRQDHRIASFTDWLLGVR
ncbi:LysR substrate-binding domain-containing protein [Pseudomonas benzenivorans]|uniref:LysR family transcriptional regulator n=1 Tax=Pseudomonas benzenivorans TaxID=556533 RepID=A0ABY5HDA1_9PSED|nr:LysR substrate-binding domain-containing protein [Pseudomonas benzenivorans]UTW09245.1 LysR family transcriptional regulator [Pseudomonas benzenivorans]